MGVYRSRIPLPVSGSHKHLKRECYHHSRSPGFAPKAWEVYIQSRRTARQDRLWENEEEEKLGAFNAALVEYESLGSHFLFEKHDKGAGAVNRCFSGDRVASFASVLFGHGVEEGEGEGGEVEEEEEEEVEGEGSGGKPSMFTDDVYPAQVPVWERRERELSPPAPPPLPPAQKPEKSPEEQKQESIEAMLERCRGARNCRKRLARKELLGMRKKEFLSEEISLFERVLVEGKAPEVGFPVHKDGE